MALPQAVAEENQATTGKGKPAALKKRYLMAPGPTPVPPEVLLEMAQPIMHHRTPQFEAIMKEVKEGLKFLFQTRQDVLVFASTGTGAMEGAVANCFREGDAVLVVNGGKFGERWGKIAEAYGLNVIWLPVEWGSSVYPGMIHEHLNVNPNIRGVLMQGCETSTTVKHNVRQVASIVKNHPDTILVVDGITSVGVFDLSMDEVGIDVLIGGSQKAIMLPPGLAFAALSEKAWKCVDRGGRPRFYFDFKKERKNLLENTTAYTPAISLIFGLRKVLEMMRAEGLENIFKRHDRLARATRAAFKEMGLSLLAPIDPAEGVTGAYVPKGIDGGKLVKVLRDEFGVTLAGGQDQLKGKIVRLAHMGYFSAQDIILSMGTIEMALRKLGDKIEFGRGPGAAQEILLEEYL